MEYRFHFKFLPSNSEHTKLKYHFYLKLIAKVLFLLLRNLFVLIIVYVLDNLDKLFCIYHETLYNHNMEGH